MKRRNIPWDMDALRAAIAAATSWFDAAARYNAATGQRRDNRDLSTRANQFGIKRPFAVRNDIPWDYAAVRAAVAQGKTWKDRAALYNEATGQSRDPKHLCHFCGDKRILPPESPNTAAAIREAVAHGKGWDGVAAIFNARTGRKLTAKGVSTLATRAGLKLAQDARFTAKHPLILALEASADKLEGRQRRDALLTRMPIANRLIHPDRVFG